MPYAAFLAVLMSSNEPKFPPFFVENTLMVVLHQVALKSDTIAMVRSYAHISARAAIAKQNMKYY